jgi:fibronectin type 3 domain-containing protein
MARVLGESELALSGLSDARAAEVASMLGAEGVVIGTVDEYGAVAVRGHPYPQVGISVRMIDCASGKIMWSADLAKRADSKSAILSSFARKVVHELVAGLYPKWGLQRYDPRAAPLAAAPAPYAAPAAPSPALPPPPPQKPNAFTLSDMGLREVTLSWTEPAARASEYIVERAPAKDGPFQTVGRVAASRLSYRDAGSPQSPLADDTLYFYRLSSVSADGQKSDPSTVRESMTAPPPEAPAGVAASAPAPRAVKLSWTPAPPEARVGEWKVERTPDDGDSFVSLGSVRKPEFQEGGTKESPLADETAYRYRVRAVNAVGAIGPWCEPVRVETLPPPAPVSGVEAAGGEVRCVPVSWKASADPFVVRYVVYRADGEAGEFRKLADVKGTAFLDGGRNPGSLPDAAVFRYRVAAVNAVESEGAPSESCEAKTRPVPPAVTGVQAEGGLPRMTRLAWTASPDEKVIGYHIQRSDLDGDFADIATVDGRETVSYEDRGRARRQALGTLGDGTTYLYRVSAFNTARAAGEWSEMADARTKPAPRAPVGVVAESGQPRRIALSWQAAPEPDIAHYEVEWSADGKKFRAAERVVAVGEGAPALVVSELEDSETRHFRIKAVDKDTIESAWSKVQSAMTKPLPPAPEGLRT